MKRAREMTTVGEVERHLDRCLAQLRATEWSPRGEHHRGNTVARAALEYRIGRLRERKGALGG